MLNRLRYLFTGTLRMWVAENHCMLDEQDCHQCGGRLSHDSMDFLSKKDALDYAKEHVEEMTQETAIVQEQIEGFDFMVFSENRTYCVRVFAVHLE